MSTRSALATRPGQARALEAAGAEVEVTDGDRIADALDRLGSRGITSLVVEGGAGLHQAFWEAGEVDMVRLYVAPLPGQGGIGWLDAERLPVLGSAGRMRPDVVRQLGPDVRIDYVHGTD